MGKMDDIESKLYDIERAVEDAGYDTKDALLELVTSIKSRRKIKIKCATCKGEGLEHYRCSVRHRDETRTCCACKGIGYVEAYTDENGNPIKCATCKGNGIEHYSCPVRYRNETRICPACKGKGYA